MSIIPMKFNFADLVAARPVREGRHLSCWEGGYFELQVNINHPCMFCGWWLGNAVCFKGKLLLVSFSLPGRKEGRNEKTWYLEGPSKKQAVRLSVYCVASS
jgi:hypothetical protein